MKTEFVCNGKPETGLHKNNHPQFDNGGEGLGE